MCAMKGSGGLNRKLYSSVKKQKTGLPGKSGKFRKPVTFQLKPEKEQRLGS